MRSLVISGHSGRLEVRCHINDLTRLPTALVLPSSAQEASSINCGMTSAMCKAFISLGLNVVTLNYRGVGRSQGVPSANGDGELCDAAICLDWLELHAPDCPSLWIASHNWGAYVAMQLLMRRPGFIGFIVANLPVLASDFSFLTPCPVSGLVLQAEKDKLIFKEPTQRIVTKLSLQSNKVDIQLDNVKDADRSFADHYDALAEHICRYVAKSMHYDRDRNAA